MEAQLQSIIGFIPLFSGVLLFTGFLKLYCHYKYFGALVTDYLEISEVLLMFMDNLLAFIGLFILAVIIGLQIIPDPQDIQIMRDCNSHSFLGRVLFYFKHNYSVFLIIFTLTIVSLFAFKKSGEIFFYERIVILFGIWIPLPLLSAFFIDLMYFQKIEFESSTLLFLFSSLTMMLYVLMSGVNEVYKISAMKFYRNYSIKIDGDEILQNDNYYFIGKTKGYVFFKDKLNNSLIVYPASKLNKIIISKNV